MMKENVGIWGSRTTLESLWSMTKIKKPTSSNDVRKSLKTYKKIKVIKYFFALFVGSGFCHRFLA